MVLESQGAQEEEHETMSKLGWGGDTGVDGVGKPKAPNDNFAYFAILSRDSLCLAGPPVTQ